MYGTARVEGVYRVTSDEQSMELQGALYFNDPQQLALFPFARNPLSLKMSRHWVKHGCVLPRTRTAKPRL